MGIRITELPTEVVISWHQDPPEDRKQDVYDCIGIINLAALVRKNSVQLGNERLSTYFLG